MLGLNLARNIAINFINPIIFIKLSLNLKDTQYDFENIFLDILIDTITMCEIFCYEYFIQRTINDNIGILRVFLHQNIFVCHKTSLFYE